MRSRVCTWLGVVGATCLLSGCVTDQRPSTLPADRPSHDPNYDRPSSAGRVPLTKKQRHEVVSMVQYLLPKDQQHAPVTNLRATPAQDGSLAVCGTALTPDGARNFYGRLTLTFYVWTLSDASARKNASVRSQCRKSGL